jgi:hypothetical protein
MPLPLCWFASVLVGIVAERYLLSVDLRGGLGVILGVRLRRVVGQKEFEAGWMDGWSHLWSQIP